MIQQIAAYERGCNLIVSVTFLNLDDGNNLSTEPRSKDIPFLYFQRWVSDMNLLQLRQPSSIVFVARMGQSTDMAIAKVV